MIIHDKETGLVVYPNFDSGDYMGSFHIMHNELNYISHDDPKFKILQMIIATYVGKYLDGEWEDDNKTEHIKKKIPEQKGYNTDDEARSYIENEGIGYAVQSYIDASQFSNPKTRELWQKACDSLNELEKHLQI